MSLILDALRRADAERERDPRRGIHAQPAPVPDADEDYALPARRWLVARRLLPWAVGVVMLLALLVGWRELRLTPDVWTESGRDAREAPAVAARSEPLPASAAVIEPPPVPTLASVPAPTVVPNQSAPRMAARAQASAPPAWPEQAPRLTITGGVYSSDPTQRMLIVNGDVHPEGGEPVDGVRIEQILPKAAILRFQGQRYEMAY